MVPRPGLSELVSLRRAAHLQRYAGVLIRSRFGNPKIATDLVGKHVRDLCMARHGFYGAGRRIHPKGMRATLALEHASVLPQVAKQRAALHSTVTVSRSASGGRPRRPSSRRSSRISAIASAKLARASSFVRPWPFAPGISGQYAMTQSPSRSKTAVNSLRISDLVSTLPRQGPAV